MVEGHIWSRWDVGPLAIRSESIAFICQRSLTNYPNPFNPETSIPLTIGVGEGSWVDVAIYNGLGQKMRTLYAGTLQPGKHVLQWDGRDDRGGKAATGTYLYRLNVEGKTHVRRLLLLR